MQRSLLLLFFFFFTFGCSEKEIQQPKLFTNITAQTGIKFRNDIQYTEQLNPYTFRNFYNGAGVAIGDINNDGLQDIYFTSNQTENKLYLNKGSLFFEDITIKANVSCGGSWSTGVTFVDINADGWLDIYVCKSGDPHSLNRNNQLFINNRDLTFSEKSKEYGLDIMGLSVQAAFFDYDKDGDLDCYLLTNSIKSVGNFTLSKNQRAIPDEQNAGNKFFINDKGIFRDFSKEANIYRSSIGFGLGITLGDFNNDTWTDIFISNDFFERDYLYINDQKGKFIESLTDYFGSISMGSMGADFADLDNDGTMELFVTEMLPDSLNRKKTKTIFENWNKYQLNLESGYFHQFGRNVLQKKVNDHSYAEVGRLASVAATEWSWGALLFDMNNDGNRDVFIANGIYKDLLDRDYLTYSGDEENVRNLIQTEKQAIIKLIEQMPVSRFSNYAYCNDGELTFNNLSTTWGLDEPLVSSGSAYGDLDNDGDLELVVSNLNDLCTIYKNNLDTASCKSISFDLRSDTKNQFSLGAKVTVMTGGKSFIADNFVVRGYQSSVQPRITIGLGKVGTAIDSALIQWPDGKYSKHKAFGVNKIHLLKEDDFKLFDYNPWSSPPSNRSFYLELISNRLFKHQGNQQNDFNRDRLLPMMYSNESPSVVVSDVDKDGTNDFYVTGGKGQHGQLIQFRGDRFVPADLNNTSHELASEETSSMFFDADQDNDLDFYLAFGGRSLPKSSSALMDRIFLNDGKNNYSEAAALPFMDFISTSAVESIDFDKDGDLDLIVAERFDPFTYGVGGRGFLFENVGSGKYKDVTSVNAPSLIDIGMITDLKVLDWDSDGWQDIVIVGDWMPITILKNNSKKFEVDVISGSLTNTTGWWNKVEVKDLNRDGKPDLVIGNHGLNTFFKSGDRMYVKDFDGNGSVEQIFCTKVNGRYFPILERDELISQIPSLKKKLLYYKDYANKSIDQLFEEKILSSSMIKEVTILASVMLISSPKGYSIVQLPKEAQYAPIYGLTIDDLDNDGIMDLVTGGNQYLVKPQFGRYDASEGWFFKGKLGQGSFEFLPGVSLHIKGQIRDVKTIDIQKSKYLVIAKYDDQLEIYKIRK
jgi:hypothetical protein